MCAGQTKLGKSFGKNAINRKKMRIFAGFFHVRVHGLFDNDTCGQKHLCGGRKPLCLKTISLCPGEFPRLGAIYILRQKIDIFKEKHNEKTAFYSTYSIDCPG